MRKLNYILLLFGIVVICMSCAVVLVLFYLSQNRVVANQLPLRQEWIFEADARITATPVGYKDKILFRTNEKLYAVYAQNGELAWTFSIPLDKHADPPLVQDDYVILTHLEGTTALNLDTGEIIWEVSSNDSRVDAIPVAANDDKVIIVDESILIRDLETGELLWEIQNPYARSDAIVKLQNNNLFVVFADQIRKYDIDSGELIWQNNTQDWSLQNGILDNNLLYLELREDGIAAYNLAEQNIEWERSDLFLTDYPPTKYKNTLLIGTSGSVPTAIDATTGQTLWEADELSDYDDYQTPLIYDDQVYIRGLFLNNIYSLNLDDGDLISHINLGIPDIVSNNASYSLGPIQVGEMIVFPIDNKLLAYGKQMD